MDLPENSLGIATFNLITQTINMLASQGIITEEQFIEVFETAAIQSAMGGEVVGLKASDLLEHTLKTSLDVTNN